ncbi:MULTISPECIES: DUF2735 domain-containing protein [Methylobacterium]|jgi:hypothetical protein|uniref:DUF2735 domain-containing protein n=1 Tax=Methylobacterium longum TaxID=767694 RepID=A0ABT8AI13_9HYPH|nr:MULTISPECIES: DUF2735 domain-containing protein [Methylobacterium]MCJ2100093.1 DUF2735 domain-containing protein [Methylobacterium sp. E-046]MDN3569389.1 DUF2735 domain-containing protein [Methylobacterium longum]GJE12316.1 hypothetical protein FOHLNKBM_3363 [Methylobacterium longum]
MAVTDPRETAKIYDLSAFRRAQSTPRVIAEAKPAPAASIGGGAWYHEAAIREDERPRRP